MMKKILVIFSVLVVVVSHAQDSDWDYYFEYPYRLSNLRKKDIAVREFSYTTCSACNNGSIRTETLGRCNKCNGKGTYVSTVDNALSYVSNTRATSYTCDMCDGDGKYAYKGYETCELCDGDYEELLQYTGTTFSFTRAEHKKFIAQNKKEIKLYTDLRDEIGEKFDYKTKLVPYRRDGLIGYYDKDLNLVIDFQYLKVTYFDEHGYARVKGANGWGLIDKNNNEIIKLVNDKISIVHNAFYLIEKQNSFNNTKWYTMAPIDYPSGSVTFDAYVPLRNSSTIVSDLDSDNFYFLKDYGNPKPLAIDNIASLVQDANGNLLVRTTDNRKGLLDQYGEIILEPEYHNLVPTKDGNYYLCKGFNESTIYEIANNRIIHTTPFDGLEDKTKSGFIKVIKEDLVGVFLIDKQMFIQPKYTDVKSIYNHEGTLLMEVKDVASGKVGVVDYLGNIIIPFEYYECSMWSNGVRLYKKKYKGKEKKWKNIKALK